MRPEEKMKILCAIHGIFGTFTGGLKKVKQDENISEYQIMVSELTSEISDIVLTKLENDGIRKEKDTDSFFYKTTDDTDATMQELFNHLETTFSVKLSMFDYVSNERILALGFEMCETIPAELICELNLFGFLFVNKEEDNSHEDVNFYFKQL